MNTYPGGYSRWPSLRKSDTCDTYVRRGPDPVPFTGSMNIGVCGKPAVKIVLSAGLYIGMCQDCLNRVDPKQFKTKEQYDSTLSA